MEGQKIDLETYGDKASVDYADWSKKNEAEDAWKNLSVRDAGKFKSKFQRLCVDGFLPEPFMKSLGDGLSEITISGHPRAGCFLDSKVWCITHFWQSSHFKKKRINTQIERATEARREHIGRSQARNQ